MRKQQNRKTTRDTGTRTNYFSEEQISSPSAIQRTIDYVSYLKDHALFKFHF